MPSRYATMLVLALAVMTGEQALAHGEARARHGGTAVMASDLGFELVGIPGGVALYIEDHGKPLPATGFRGKMVLLSGNEKSEAELVAIPDRGADIVRCHHPYRRAGKNLFAIVCSAIQEHLQKDRVVVNGC